MARIIFVLALVLVAHSSLSACDACGCSASGNSMGVLQGFRNNFAGVGLYLTPFRTLGHHQGKDYFYTSEIFGRYHLGSRWKVALSLPFQYNLRMPAEAEKYTVKGLGDSKITAAYALVNDKYFGDNGKIYWEAALGAKLPTGKFDRDISDADLPENFNLGSGSFGLIAQTALQLDFGKMGVTTNAGWLLNGESPTGYRFGSRASISSRAFWRWFLGENVIVLPNAGLSSEWIESDHFANGRSNAGTGGRGLFFSGGINFKVSDFFIGSSVQIPLYEDYSNGEVTPMNRVNIDVSYFF
ncbi:MAG TPA: hypothetical protein PKC40_00700 [Saprospiraceae bacterium]|nr:hypothetical protein [Saprospiraceae bacterium]